MKNYNNWKVLNIDFVDEQEQNGKRKGTEETSLQQLLSQTLGSELRPSDAK